MSHSAVPAYTKADVGISTLTQSSELLLNLGIMKLAIERCFCFGGCLQAQGTNALTLKSRIEFANVDGRIDHFSAEVKGQRLFMAALGNHTIEAYPIWPNRRVSTLI